jgi:glycosyltransferase involved in cell wall biosynthesis
MRRGEFDAFLVMGWHAASYRDAMRAGWRYRVPLLVRGDSHLGNDPTARRLAKRLIYPLFVRRFSVCLSVGSRSEEYFRYYGARRIVRAPHYVDNALFARLAEERRPRRDTIRAEWGIAPDAVEFLFAGKLIPRKRPQDFIEALRALADRRVVGLIVGEGALRRECEALARGAEGRIRFAGFLNQSQMPRAYAAADVLVLPSSIDTWGLVVNEAMASGRPAIVSRAVGCEPDMIRAGVSGFSHDTGDASALGRLMARVTGDAAERERLSRGAREVAREFTVEAACAGIVEGARRAISVGGGR